LEVALAQGKPSNPFKLNPKWLKEEDFVKKIKEVWEPYDGSLRESAPLQFLQNLKTTEKAAIIWSKEKRQKDERTLKEVEEALDLLYTSEGYGYF
jgi:hypothetical protein